MLLSLYLQIPDLLNVCCGLQPYFNIGLRKVELGKYIGIYCIKRKIVQCSLNQRKIIFKIICILSIILAYLIRHQLYLENTICKNIGKMCLLGINRRINIMKFKYLSLSSRRY